MGIRESGSGCILPVSTPIRVVTLILAALTRYLRMELQQACRGHGQRISAGGIGGICMEGCDSTALGIPATVCDVYIMTQHGNKWRDPGKGGAGFGRR